MSNLLDRINSRMSLVEYELYLLRSINNLYSLEDNRRYMYERDRLYNRVLIRYLIHFFTEDQLNQIIILEI